MSMRTEYMHGGDIYRNPVEYDFSVNINPLGMPRKSLEAAKRGLLLCGRYPDWRGEELCRAIAKKEGVPAEQILLGNGAAELIYALCFGIKPQKGLVTAPSFGEYEAALLAAGACPVFWELPKDREYRTEEGILRAITEETGIFFFCNPNNPTGNLTGRSLLLEIAQRCEETGTWFCLDECFLPFLFQEEELSMKGMLTRFPHLVILRAFTKIYGMPGLRLGYAMSANRELVQAVRSCMQPWNTSLPAQLAGLEALSDREYLDRTRQLISRERAYLYGELAAGLAEKVWPSEANFLFFRARRDLKERLLKEGVLIRSCSDYRNLSEGYFRIGIRTHKENEELIRRWRRAAEMEEKWQNQS